MTTSESGNLAELKPRVSVVQGPFQDAHHLPGEIYFSDEVAELEKTRIWMKEWLCLARSDEFERVGDFQTFRLFDEPIVVVRKSETEFSAFSNVCLHRGVEIAYGSGNTNKFSCPYHAWLYDVDGKLVRAPLMEQSATDLKDCALPKIRVETWRGWVFVNFDKNAQSLEERMRPYSHEFRHFHGDQVKTAKILEFEVECNWKFIVENLMDIYHVGMIHAKSFGKYRRSDGDSDKLPARLMSDGLVHLEFDAAKRTADENLPFPILPWLQEEGAAFSSSTNLFPNIKIHVSHESLRLWRIWPVTPSKTRVVAYIMLPEASFSVPDFEGKIERYGKYVEEIVEEDRVPLESLQKAVHSRYFQPGPLSHLEEGIHHWLNHYVHKVIG